MISVSCPGSCGELYQGFWNQKPVIVSCPINLFSRVSVRYRGAICFEEELQEIRDWEPLSEAFSDKPKLARAFELAARTFLASQQKLADLEFSLNSELSVGKGMASSTADIAALICAMAGISDYSLTDSELVALCRHVEPTDSTPYPHYAVLDRVTGEVLKSYPNAYFPDAKILILEGEKQVSTQDRFTSSLLPRNTYQQYQMVFNQLDHAFEQSRFDLLCRASTANAELNQDRVKTPAWRQLKEIQKQFSSQGINIGITIAHSGSVVGFIFDSLKTNEKEIVNQVLSKELSEFYPKQYTAKLISGGVVKKS